VTNSNRVEYRENVEGRGEAVGIGDDDLGLIGGSVPVEHHGDQSLVEPTVGGLDAIEIEWLGENAGVAEASWNWLVAKLTKGRSKDRIEISFPQCALLVGDIVELVTAGSAEKPFDAVGVVVDVD